jgi:hypothetical protein
MLLLQIRKFLRIESLTSFAPVTPANAEPESLSPEIAGPVSLPTPVDLASGVIGDGDACASLG